MDWLKSILLKRIIGAFLASFNPNSSTFYLGIVNAIVTYLATHFGWLAYFGITPEAVNTWLVTTGAIWLQQMLGKIANGAFPGATYGTITPPPPSAPSAPGVPVMATVPSSAKITATAADTPTSPVKR